MNDWTLSGLQLKVRRCQHTCWCWFSRFNSFYRCRVFHFLTRSLEIVLKFWAPKASFRRNSVIIDFLVNKLILSQTKYVVICFTLKPSQPENRSRIYFWAVAVRFWKCLIFGAINKTWIEFQIGLRIGSDFRSDRTLHRTRSDWYFRFWRRIIIFGKSFFNNYTGGSDLFSFEPYVPLIRKIVSHVSPALKFIISLKIITSAIFVIVSSEKGPSI